VTDDAGPGARRDGAGRCAPGPRVSVILPTRNRAAILPRAVRSVLRQTFADLELVVVDDHSTDATPAVLDELDDPRVVRVRRERSQLEGNPDNPRNAGLAVARGEYVCCVDDDDMYRPRFVERMVAFLDARPELGLAYCDTVFHRREGGVEVADVDRSVDFDRALLLERNYVSTTEIMARRTCLEAVGGWRRHVKRGSDHDLVLRVSARFEVAHVAEVLGDNLWGRAAPCQPSRHYADPDFEPSEGYAYSPRCLGRSAATAGGPGAEQAGVAPRLAVLVQVCRRDLDLLEEGRAQLAALSAAGHLVRFACVPGEAAEVDARWAGVGRAVAVDVPPVKRLNVRKTTGALRALLAEPWDWVVKLDADVAIAGWLPGFVERVGAGADVIGSPFAFGPGMAAVEAVGPPELPGDPFAVLGRRYVHGFCYAVRRAAVARALPVLERVAPRMRAEDPTVTAVLAAQGSRFALRRLNAYAERAAEVDPGAPVVHVEARDPARRRALVARARARHAAERPDGAQAGPLAAGSPADRAPSGPLGADPPLDGAPFAPCGADPPADLGLTFVTYAELARDAAALAPRVPRGVRAVFAVPRSGALAAAVLATELHLPLGLVGAAAPAAGRRLAELGQDVPAAGPVLLVDDSWSTGGAMWAAREALRAQGVTDVVTCALYVTEPGRRAVDLWARVAPPPRIFRWNLWASARTRRVMCDLDGVLCEDPAAFDDDGDAYRRAIASASPRCRPLGPVHSIVTNRIERWRGVTESWLRRHGVEHGGLHMQAHATAAARRAAGDYGAWKGRVYAGSDALLFVESDEEQARRIREVSGRPVLSLETEALHR